MKHWHKCTICTEYFECCCDASDGLSPCCRECSRVLGQTLLVDNVLKELMRLPGNKN